MLFLCVVVLFTKAVFWLVVGAGVSFAYFAWLARAQWSTQSFPFGRANTLTLSRYLVITVVAGIYPVEHNILLVLVLLVCLCLDGIDGYVARRYRESSDFGRYLDMEVDAYAICVLSLLLWKYHDLNPVVVLAGTLRYTYALLLRLTVKNQRLEPKRYYASTIAVLFYLSLASVFLIDNGVTHAIVYASSILLLVSFTRSYRFQWVGQ